MYAKSTFRLLCYDLGSRFSPSAMWFLGIGLRQGLYLQSHVIKSLGVISQW